MTVRTWLARRWRTNRAETAAVALTIAAVAVAATVAVATSGGGSGGGTAAYPDCARHPDPNAPAIALNGCPVTSSTRLAAQLKKSDEATAVKCSDAGTGSYVCYEVGTPGLWLTVTTEPSKGTGIYPVIRNIETTAASESTPPPTRGFGCTSPYAPYPSEAGCTSQPDGSPDTG